MIDVSYSLDVKLYIAYHADCTGHYGSSPDVNTTAAGRHFDQPFTRNRRTTLQTNGICNTISLEQWLFSLCRLMVVRCSEQNLI